MKNGQNVYEQPLRKKERQRKKEERMKARKKYLLIDIMNTVFMC